MAEILKTLNTRIGLKIDTLENWNNSTIGLLKGEIAIATTAATVGTGLTEPVCMIKIGEDGVKTFSELDWNFYAKASDVLTACKTEEGLKTFINNVVAEGNFATKGELNTLAGRVSTAEGAIELLNGDAETAGSVAKAIKDAIDALDLANTYAAKEHEHVVADITDFDTEVKKYNYATKTEAQGYADAKDEAIAAAKKAGDDAQADITAYKTSNNAALAEVKATADAAAVKSDVDAALADRYTKSETDAKFALKGEAYNDSEVRGLIADNAAAIDANAKAIAAEESRAKGVEESLQTQINTIIDNPDTEGVINSINEFTEYINSHGEIAEGFRTDIDKNTKDIATNAEAITANGEAIAANAVDIEQNAKDIAANAKAITDLGTAVDTKLENYYTETEADAKFRTEAQVNGQIDTKITALNLAGTYEPIGAEERAAVTAQGKVDALANGAVKTNTEAIATINEELDTYGDIVTHNVAEFATAAQGAKADSAVQSVTSVANNGIKATRTGNDVVIDWDSAVTLVFDCGGAGVVANAE